MDNFYSRCLLCTCRPDGTPHLHIFSEAGNQLQLADKINKFLNIQIEAELPQNVCHSCMEKLEVTHELVTSSQQARIMLLQMKRQSEEVKQEDCSMTELDSYQPATDSAAVDNEMDIKENEIPMDNCSAEDFDQSDFALHCTKEGTVEQTETFEEVLISKIEIEEHAIKLEPGEDQLDCLPADVQPPLENKLAENQVSVPKLLECDLCLFYSDNKAQLAAHMQAHLQTPNITADESRRHPAKKGKKFLNCGQCGLKYFYPEMMAWHTKNCHGTKAIVKVIKINKLKYNFQCVFCKTVCKTFNLMLRHLFSQHKISNSPFQCNACKRQFTRRENLRSHQFSCKFMKTRAQDNVNSGNFHTENVKVSKQSGVKCKMCSEVFESEHLKTIHFSKVHATKMRKCRYKCVHCEEPFNFFPHLQSHCHSKHPGECVLQCDICDAGFVSRCGYLEHKKYQHITQKFTCNICSAAFSTPRSLKEHVAFIHTVLRKTLACKFCRVKFKCKAYLQQHVRHRHTGPILHCQHCEYNTRSRNNFIGHLRCMHFRSP